MYLLRFCVFAFLRLCVFAFLRFCVSAFLRCGWPDILGRASVMPFNALQWVPGPLAPATLDATYYRMRTRTPAEFGSCSVTYSGPVPQRRLHRSSCLFFFLFSSSCLRHLHLPLPSSLTAGPHFTVAGKIPDQSCHERPITIPLLR